MHSQLTVVLCHAAQHSGSRWQSETTHTTSEREREREREKEGRFVIMGCVLTFYKILIIRSYNKNFGIFA